MAGVKGKSGTGNRKSVSELKLSGTFREDRHGHLIAPAGKLEIIEPQEHLTNGNVQLDRVEIFNYFANFLYEEGTSQKIDSILISQLVEAYCIYVQAINYARADPEAILGRKLASAVALETGREIRSIMNEFRMTPSTRGMSDNKKDEAKDDPVAAFLNAKAVN